MLSKYIILKKNFIFSNFFRNKYFCWASGILYSPSWILQPDMKNTGLIIFTFLRFMGNVGEIFNLKFVHHHLNPSVRLVILSKADFYYKILRILQAFKIICFIVWCSIQCCFGLKCYIFVLLLCLSWASIPTWSFCYFSSFSMTWHCIRMNKPIKLL